MVSRRFALLLLPVLASCGTVQHWREVRSGPVSQAEVYDAIDYLARADGFAPSVGECDRGYGVWVSRWRQRQLGLGHPGRYRLHAEILLPHDAEFELYGNAFSHCSRKTRLVMAELGIPFVHKPIDLIETAGAATVKRVAPLAVLALLILFFLKRRKG